MHRRAVLCWFVTGLAGCGGRSDADRAEVVSRDHSPSPVLSVTSGTVSTDTEDEVPAAAAVSVRNESGRERYVTVAVYDGDRTVFSASDLYAADGPTSGRTYSGAVDRNDVYHVIVETDDGARAETTWRTVGALSGLAVVLKDGGVDVRQVARCDPHCQPISDASRSAVADPATTSTPQTTQNGDGAGDYALRVVNAGSDRRTVRVELTHGGRTVLDGSYRPFPGLELRFPTYAGDRSFDVTVESDGNRWTASWESTEGLVLPLAVDDRGVRLDCDEGSATLGISNAGGQQLVSVRVAAGGELVREERYGVSALEPVFVPRFLDEPGVYEVTVVRENGATASEQVFVCDETELHVYATRDEITLQARHDGG